MRFLCLLFVLFVFISSASQELIFAQVESELNYGNMTLNIQCNVSQLECSDVISELSTISNWLNTISEKIKENSDTNLMVYSVTLIFTGVAITVAIVTTRTAVQQTKHMEEEKKHRLRPLIVRREYFPHKDGLLRPHKITPEKILFRIVNKGPLTATKIIFKWYVAIVTDNKLHDIRSSEEHYPDGRPLPDLGPEESYSVDLFIDYIHNTHALKNTDCVFGFIINYQDEYKTPFEYRLDGYFAYGGDLMLLRPEEMSFEI